jgi:hypothetical protein
MAANGFTIEQLAAIGQGAYYLSAGVIQHPGGKSFSSGPIEAIGKIVSINDPSAKPLCTATLIAPNLIVAPLKCVLSADGLFDGNKYFILNNHGSSGIDTNAVSRGEQQAYSARIFSPRNSTSSSIDGEDSGLTIISLSPKISAETFSWRAMSSLPSTYNGNPYWAIAGNKKSSNDMLYSRGNTIINDYTRTHTCGQSGCWVGNRNYSGKYVIADSELMSNISDGSPLFAELCGEWQIIGVKGGSAFYSIASIWDSLVHAYKEYGYGIIDAEPCAEPSQLR